MSSGCSFDFVTNRILYKLCSSVVKKNADNVMKGYGE